MQVLVMAAYLGLPYGGDIGTEHLWVADAALCAQRPLGWASLTDEADGATYYQNCLTGEVMWEHPQVAYLRGVVAAVNMAESLLRASAHERGITDQTPGKLKPQGTATALAPPAASSMR